jgi:serine protease Do
VLVTGVEPQSDAAEKGVRPGDVIVRTGTGAAEQPADLRAAVAAAKKSSRSSVLVMISRNGQNAFVPLKVAG